MCSGLAVSERGSFRPPLWAWLLTLLLGAVMLRLGFWQLDRADEKQALLDAYEAALAAPALEMPSSAPEAGSAPQRVTVRGAYVGGAQFLLDNQMRDGQPGVNVWTGMRREGGGIIIIDRGWIADPGRDTIPELPVDTGRRTLTGLWKSLPRSGFRVANDVCNDLPVQRVQRVQYPAVEELACRFDGDVADGILLLQDDGSALDSVLGERDLRPLHLQPQTHLGYAVQWFGFSLALLVIFVVVNRKKR